MIAWDYPIGFSYGAKDGYYYGPNGIIGPYHRGDDWFCPAGSDVVVNGVVIAKTGSTGNVSGPHLHVGKFVSGSDVNPNGGGKDVVGAVVLSIGQDSTNGKFIRLKASDGSTWVYLHLSEILVKQGDKILVKEDDMLTQSNKDKLIKMAKRAEPTANELSDPTYDDANRAISDFWEAWGKHNYAEDQKPKQYKKVTEFYIKES